MDQLAEQLQELGSYFQGLGLQVMPYSFAMYTPVRWLEFIWNRGYTRLVKAVWYAALGLTYMAGGMDTEGIVMYICLIEASDLFFQQLEIGRARRTQKMA